MRHKLLLIILALLTGTVPLTAQRSRQETRVALRALGVPFYEDCSVELLPTAKVKFDALFEEIRQAQKYVHMDYFKFQDDSICSELFLLLARKVKEGVSVKVLFDDVGNKYSDLPLRRAMLDTLRNQGVEIFPFDKMRFPWVNHLFHRDHHKIVVIDGHCAYTGGMNITDYYLYGKPSIGEWRDMHMRLSGPIVAGYEHIFNVMWYDVTGQFLPDAPASNFLPNGDISMAMVSRMPNQQSSNMRDAIAAAIDNAQECIQIVNPYSTLTRTVRQALYRALQRGVKLQFMVSYNGDAPVAQNVQAIEMHKLMKRGAEIYYYENGFHHGKEMMIDNDFCFVGTTNMDGRSLRNDYEVSAFIFDQTTTAQLQEIFRQDIERHCFLLTPEVWKERFSTGTRFVGRLFTPIRSSL